jgi:hypothetical protein
LYTNLDSEEACPYEVTQIVTEKNRPNKESDREIVHEVPQPISNKAAEKHKSRGEKFFGH